MNKVNLSMNAFLVKFLWLKAMVSKLYVSLNMLYSKHLLKIQWAQPH
jgi:hypothetical protein